MATEILKDIQVIYISDVQYLISSNESKLVSFLTVLIAFTEEPVDFNTDTMEPNLKVTALKMEIKNHLFLYCQTQNMRISNMYFFHSLLKYRQ